MNKTFWQGVGLTWIYMLCVFVWDTFFLDWVLFANIKHVRLPGTEHMNREYNEYVEHLENEEDGIYSLVKLLLQELYCVKCVN